MEQSKGSMTPLQVNQIEEANLVVLIFSKIARRRQYWEDLAKATFYPINGRIIITKDQVLRRGLLLDAQEAVPEQDSSPDGRVYEIFIDTQTGPLSLVDCRAYRESPLIGEIESAEDVQMIFQPLWLHHAHEKPGLAVFDMDSTLIQQEVIDELARTVGRYEQVAAITEAAMRGELDFEASLRKRVAQLKGVSTDVWDHLKRDKITFTPGARELIKVLKYHGWKTAVLSGGFTPLANWVKDTLGLDYAYANQLIVDVTTSTLTGELVPGASIIHAQKKRDLLLQLAESNNIPIHATIAIGDGSNDLPMMAAAGLGIAFNAKPKVQSAAPARLNSSSLMDVTYILGFAGAAGMQTSAS